MEPLSPPSQQTAPKRHLPSALQGVRLPVVAAPLFIIPVPELVIARCKARTRVKDEYDCARAWFCPELADGGA